MKVLKIANKIIKSDDWIKHAQESQKKPNVSSHSQSAASSNTGQNDNKSNKDEEEEFEDSLL